MQHSLRNININNVMIEIKGVTKNYGKQKIVDELTLTVKRGSVFGFLGPNGAGKTTTIKMLVGLNKPDGDKVKINKLDPTHPETRYKIGFMPENPYFYDHLNGMELLKYCYELSNLTNSAMKFANSTKKQPNSTKKISRIRKTTRNNTALYDQILDNVGLLEAKNKMIRTYSKGMKQRLGLAQAIVHDPNYIFLDEPLDGLDPIGRIEIKNIIKKLKKTGKTIFFNTHILADVEEICDQIGIINNGKLVYHGSVKKFGSPLEKKFVELINSKK